MKKKKYDYFISYSSKDEVAARNLYIALEDEGYTCWIASKNIGTGHYPKAIVKGIKESKALIVLFSSNSNESTPVLQELELANNNNLLIIPLRIENFMPTESMEYYIRINNWFDNFEYQSVSDFNGFVKKLKDSPKANNIVIQNFISPSNNKSNSFSIKSIAFVILFFTLILTIFNLQAKTIEQKNKIIEQQQRFIDQYLEEQNKNKNNSKVLSQAEHIKNIAGYKEAIRYFKSDNKNLFYSNYRNVSIIYYSNGLNITNENRLYNYQKILKLFIKTEPILSNIEILNSKERYRNNTNLEKGIYDIKISKDGYREKRILIELNQDRNLTIVLDKLTIDRSK